MQDIKAIVFSNPRVHIQNQVLMILNFGNREKPTTKKELGSKISLICIKIKEMKFNAN